MSITKKAISLGTTAALIASLAATIAAPAAFASTAVTSAGVVPIGGTSTGTASFQFCENTAGAWNAGGTITVTIQDSTGAGGHVTFSGTPVVTAPGALGASASVSGNALTITITSDDNTNALCVTVGGLKIVADNGATTGAIQATAGGTISTGTYTSSTVTATGTLQALLPAASTSASVSVTSTCHFAVTGGSNTTINFSDTSDPVAVSGVSTSGAIDTLTIGATTAAHAVGATVTQTVANCSPTALASPGTVGNAVFETTKYVTNVNPGEQNQPAGDVSITEATKSAGYLAAGMVITFTLPTGVLFSTSPVASSSGAGFALTSNLCQLSFDRTSCSVTVDTASTAPATVTVGNAGGAKPILIDVASTVAQGTAINVTVTASPAINVNVTSATIANASRVIVGVAATPTIFINYNGQQSGMITLTESTAGQFVAGPGPTDAFGLCITTSETFTFAPYAIVTTGDLKLLNPSTSGAVTTQVGHLYSVGTESCASWTVFSASTVASTISIVGATASGPLTPGATNGPSLSVPGTLTPGPTRMNVLVGDQADVAAGTAASTIVTNAVRAFKNGVVVTALSQPFIAPGSTGAAGNVTIAETLNGQLKAGETIECDVLDSAFNRNQQVYLSEANSNMLPVVSTNTASGLIAHLSDSWGYGFQITVDQQAYAPALGTITVSNINYLVVSGSTNGPVHLECYNAGATSTGHLGPVAFVSRPTSPSAQTFGTGWTCVNLVSDFGTAPFQYGYAYFGGTFNEGEWIYPADPTNINSDCYGAIGANFEVYLDYVHQLGDSVTEHIGFVGADFDQFVSNAVVGSVTPSFLDAASAKGVTQTGPFTLSTKVVKKGTYVTIMIKTTPAMAGAHVGIYIAKKGPNGVWSKFSPHTGRIANGSGVVYYYYKAGSVAWLSIRGYFTGDSTHAAAWSNAVQVKFTK